MTKIAKKIIISDLDDTIKISHTTNHIKTIIRGLFFSHAYAGMSALFQEWEKQGFEIKILSSSPKWIEKKINRFLDLHLFPKRSLHLRDWIKETKIKSYKTNALKHICQQGYDQIILIGDDTEWDPEVFYNLKKSNPNQVINIYIRSIRERPLPSDDIIRFYTAFDVAASEYKANRLSLDSIKYIFNAVYKEENMEFIFPHFVSYPKRFENFDDAELEKLNKELQRKLLSWCSRSDSN